MRSGTERAAVVLLTGLAFLAGCDAGGVAEGGTAAPESSAMTDTQILSIGREFAQCVRDHGVSNYADPTVEDGKIKITAPEGVPEQQLVQAEEACRSSLEKLPAAATRPDVPEAADMQRLLAFARCVRGKGVPDWPDPKADGSFPVRGTPLEGKTERSVRAWRACRSHWDGEITQS